MDMLPQSPEEMEAIRNAVVMRDGLLLSVFTILRRVPRRVLMVFKLNDLTRCVFFILIYYFEEGRESKGRADDFLGWVGV